MNHLKFFIFAGLIMLSPIAALSKTNPESKTPAKLASLHETRQMSSLNMRDSFDNTPLILACDHGNYTKAQNLIRKGANPHLKNEFGQAALHLCVARNAIKKDKRALTTVELLLQKGAKINVRDELGHTALHYLLSAPKVDLAMLKLLLNKGADVNAVNKLKEKNYPIDYTLSFSEPSHKSARELLLYQGAEFGESPNFYPTKVIQESPTYEDRRMRFLMRIGIMERFQ